MMIKSRLTLVYFCIVAALCLICFRMLFIITLGDKVTVSKIYDKNNLGKRGNIYDRNGTILATDLKTKSLYISSVLVKSPEALAQGISSIFSDLSKQEIIKKISDNKRNRNWILIRRNLSPAQVQDVENLKMAGIIFEEDRIRIYPQKSIVSHYAGYVDRDRKGLAGIEMQYDKKLSANQNVEIAMDVRVQDILHDELLVAMQTYRAKAASGVVINVNNGEVIALSSIPDFDANSSNKAGPDEYFNRVTNGVYELGSVMKIFTNALAIEENLVKPSSVFNVRDPIKYGRFTISDYHAIKDEMTVQEIFSESSNIGTVKIADKIGAEKQKDFLQKLGLLKKLEVDFPGLGKPIYPRLWSQISLFTISYGHGIAITPLHMAMASAAIVNGGKLYKPSFLKVGDNPESISVIKPSTSEIMRTMLRHVVEQGTGKYSYVEGYDVGGKTGTAERAESGSYNTKLTTASFVAAFPISNPQYLVYVVFDRPNYIFNTGGMVAAPVAGKVIKNIAPLLGVKPVLKRSGQNDPARNRNI